MVEGVCVCITCASDFDLWHSAVSPLCVRPDLHHIHAPICCQGNVYGMFTCRVQSACGVALLPVQHLGVHIYIKCIRCVSLRDYTGCNKGKCSIILTLYPSIDASSGIGTTFSQAILTVWPFNLWPVILGAWLGAGKRHINNTSIKMTYFLWRETIHSFEIHILYAGPCWYVLICFKAQRTGFLGVDREVPAGWPVSCRVVAPNFDKVVGVGFHTLQPGVVLGAGYHNPLGPALAVFMIPPVLHLGHTGFLTAHEKWFIVQRKRKCKKKKERRKKKTTNKINTKLINEN